MKIRIAILFVFIATITFAQTPGYDLNSIIVTTGADDPTAGIEPVDGDAKQPVDSTLDIVNWNVSFLGAPSYSSKFKGISRSVQIDTIAKKLIAMDADIYALQEVVVADGYGNALTDLLARINELSGDEYGGSYSEYCSLWYSTSSSNYPSQCLAYIWKKATVTVNNDSALLINEASTSDFGYGRLPYMLDADITFRGKTQRYFFINIHLKASTGYDDMRAGSMELLRKLLEVNFPENNVVVLGDYNVADNSGALGEIKDWGMYEDREGDGLTDFVHVAGEKENGIEHTLISNELYDELAYISEWDWNVTIDDTKNYSDHYARMTSLYVYEESGNVDPGNESIFNTGQYSFTMSSDDYQTIVDYSNDNELSTTTSYPETNENYFGASAYYANFDIVDDGSWNQTAFGTWEEAIQGGIAQALLPEKYPEAVIDQSIIYKVSFDTYSGNSTYGSETFNFECTKSAPNPEFAYTTRTATENIEVSSFGLYPNPVTDVLHITSEKRISGYKIYNANGKLVLNGDFENTSNTQIKTNELKSGLYLIKLSTSEGSISTSKFLKQ